MTTQPKYCWRCQCCHDGPCCRSFAAAVAMVSWAAMAAILGVAVAGCGTQ